MRHSNSISRQPFNQMQCKQYNHITKIIVLNDDLQSNPDFLPKIIPIPISIGLRLMRRQNINQYLFTTVDLI